MFEFKVVATFILISWDLLFISLANPLPPNSSVDNLPKGSIMDLISNLKEVVGEPVDIQDVHFYLHTSRDSGYPDRKIAPKKPVEIGATKGKIYFLIHGWTQSRKDTIWFRPLTEFILKKYLDAHVVQIDWSKSASAEYPAAVFSTKSVGDIIAHLIYELVEEENVPLENIVLIGHSLGGQICGLTGKKFYELSRKRLPLIIALDPAGPLFSVRPNEKKLNKNDADIVMVVHTNGGLLGYETACGTIDFFPNGGSHQPECSTGNSTEISISNEDLWCDHRRAHDLFLEAIRCPQLFLAKKCKSYHDFEQDICENIWASFGDLEVSSKGSFYLDTGDTSTFIEECEKSDIDKPEE